MSDLPLLIADVFECAGALRRQGDRIAATVGQTQARWQVLSVLSEGSWTASSAARRLGVSRQNVQRIANALVADGLVRADPNPQHRRAPFLRATPAGRAALGAVAARAEPWQADALEGIDPEDLAATRRVLQLLIQAADADADADADGVAGRAT